MTTRSTAAPMLKFKCTFLAYFLNAHCRPYTPELIDETNLTVSDALAFINNYNETVIWDSNVARLVRSVNRLDISTCCPDTRGCTHRRRSIKTRLQPIRFQGRVGNPSNPSFVSPSVENHSASEYFQNSCRPEMVPWGHTRPTHVTCGRALVDINWRINIIPTRLQF